MGLRPTRFLRVGLRDSLGDLGKEFWVGVGGTDQRKPSAIEKSCLTEIQGMSRLSEGKGWVDCQGSSRNFPESLGSM